MTQKATPKPLFDTIDHFDSMNTCVQQYISELGVAFSKKEYQYCLEFLKSYRNSKDTFTAYRRETERFLQWTWLINKKSLIETKRNDIRDYLEFVNNPPKNWISTKVSDRFTLDVNAERKFNPEWRPFVVRVSKADKKLGKDPDKNNYQLSNKSIEAIFAVLSSLFAFLQQEEYLESNPVALIRQKKGYIQRQQTRKVTRKLSHTQWEFVINTCEELAAQNEKHQRTLFLMSAFYLLGLRISELAYTDERPAIMGNFAPDKRGLWWFTTVGKGNKERDVAVPDELLEALKSYRTYLNLNPLPRRNETTPLFPKLRGKKGLGTRQIRNIIQEVFDIAVDKLKGEGKIDEATDLASATVHWLRHTAISNEVEYRPREHIRDDVGHENPATMDKYIDTDRVARHLSAKNKSLKPPKEKIVITD